MTHLTLNRIKRAAKSRGVTVDRMRAASVSMAAIAVLVFASIGGSTNAPSKALTENEIEQQINLLNTDNAANRREMQKLAGEASNYQDAINNIKAQVVLLEAQIKDKKGQQSALEAQLRVRGVELDRQRAKLSEVIKVMYSTGQISTIEILATSQTISDFVDADTYRNSVQARIQRQIADINALQAQLRKDKANIDRIVLELQLEQLDMNGLREQQQNLLAYNRGQQDDYNKKTANNQAKIRELVSEQSRLNIIAARAGDYFFIRFPGAVKKFDPGNYPYINAGFSMSWGGCSAGDGPDKWGYCTRQCVSYAAWAVEASGRAAPTFYGNARDWVTAAYRAGIPVFKSDPKPGDVAVSTAGGWGHVAYVERVDGKQMYISQYNRSMNGTYSEEWLGFR